MYIKVEQLIKNEALIWVQLQFMLWLNKALISLWLLIHKDLRADADSALRFNMYTEKVL